MKKNSAISVLVGLAAIVTSGTGVAGSASEELAVAMIVTMKQACDTGIPGHAAATDRAYDTWKKDNAVFLARAQKTSYGTDKFDAFVKKGVDQMLGKSKPELERACGDFQKSLLSQAP